MKVVYTYEVHKNILIEYQSPEPLSDMAYRGFTVSRTVNRYR